MTQSPDSPTRPTPRPRDPSALTSEYHKAHKQLMLWSAILFIWELIGVDLDKAKEAGGNVGAAVSILKSPQAVPWALVILIAYFLFKLTLEWKQNADARRTNPYARTDYVSALVVAGAALALYAAQTISHLQLANTGQGAGSPWWMAFVVGFGIPLLLAVMIQGFIGEQKFGGLKAVLGTSWFLTAVMIFLIVIRGSELHWKWAVAGLLANIIFILAAVWANRKINPPAKTPPDSDSPDPAIANAEAPSE